MTTNPATRQLVFRHDGPEQTLFVIDEGPYRSLYFNSTAFTQSRMDLAHPLWLVSSYTQHLLASLLFNHRPQRVLMIGLGGGCMAKFFLHFFPECRVDVVDSNPVMATVAHQFFFLPESDRLTLHCADGQHFVTAMANRSTPYDLILVDAFDHAGVSRSVNSAPFLSAIHPLLSDNGVLLFNLFRGEAVGYPEILREIVSGFPRSVLRLPVPGGNEIVFCLPQDNPFRHLNLPALQEQTLAWADQPPLAFEAFMGFLHRLIPVKQGFWHHKTSHSHHYPFRGKIYCHPDLGNRIHVL